MKAIHNITKKNSKIDDDNIIIDNTKIYLDILEYLKNSKYKIIFSINSNPITRHIYKDYIKVDYSSFYSLSQLKINNEIKNFKKIKK